MKFKFKKDMPSVRFEGFNEYHKKDRSKQNNVIYVRLIGIIGVVILLVSVLAIRLTVIQLTQSEEYLVKLDTYGIQKYVQDASRGTIEDRNGTMLVSNTSSINAVYFSVSDMSQKNASDMADFLYDNTTINLDSIDERQRKDYFLMAYPDIVDGLVTQEMLDVISASQNPDRDLYNLKISLITSELMAQHMSDEVLFKTRIESIILQTTSGSATLLEGISVEDASRISSNNMILRGVEITTDWQRSKTMGGSLSGVLGRVSTQQTGLPAEDATELLSLGLMNDSRVGLSGIEAEYDTLLRGVNSSYSITVDDDGDSAVNLLSSGTAGTNLRLTIDWELQALAEQLISDALVANFSNPLFTEMFLIVMDPNNGDVIVMAGKRIDKETGEISDYADGNYKSAFAIGSTIKGGTMYMAYKHDLTYPGEIINDAPVQIKGTAAKKSWTNLGPIDDITALARSSNVFMFEMAIRLGEGHYQYNQPLVIDESAFDTFRNDLSELGLGTKTGLDVTDEALGYRGPNDNRTSGLLLDAVIGQYDTYTPIQVAQYVSTLANDGVKVEPRLVLDGYQIDETGNKVTTYQNDIEIIDDVSHETLAFERISEGFRACVTYSNGLCRSAWSGSSYDMYSKTGTAQVFEYIDGQQIDYANLLSIGWASPSGIDDPQIAYVAVAPRLNTGQEHQEIPRIVIDAYHQKYGIN